MNTEKKRTKMYFLFGRSIPRSLSRYFVERAKHDGHHVKFASMGEFEDTEPFAEIDFNPENGICVIFQSIAQVG